MLPPGKQNFKRLTVVIFTVYRESSSIGRIPKFHDLEFLKATYKSFSFPRHWHDTYVVEVVESGTNGFYCEGRTYTAFPGSIVLINPGEIHTGWAVGNEPLYYRSLYPSPQLLQTLFGLKTAPRFPSAVVLDPELASSICDLHRTLEKHPAVAESRLVEVFSLLLERHAAPWFGRDIPAGNDAIQKSVNFLKENFANTITLDQLSVVTGLSSYHLIRSFRKNIGLPPHQFLQNIRVQRAKDLLKRGKSISEVALEVGFYDQSHFHRHFKRVVGVTPGQYAGKSNFVQDAQIRLS